MQYLIKAITAHEAEESRAGEFIQSGQIRDAEQLEGFVQGIGDEATVAAMAQAGLTVTVTPLSEPLPNSLEPQLTTFAARLGGEFKAGIMPDVLRPDGRAEYFLVEIAGGLSNQRKLALADAHINIVERDHGDWYVAKLPNRDATTGLDFVRAVRLFDAAETMAPIGASAPAAPANAAARNRAATSVYEATLHPDASVERVAEELAALGAQVVSRADNLVRLLPGTAPLIDIADLPQIAQLLPVTAPRLFDDAARIILGVDLPEPLAARTLDLDGEGEIVGVADTGIDDAHRDFADRIVAAVALGRPGDHSDPNGHGTHVAGSILGDGSQSGGRLAGVAPKANLYFQSLLDANGRLGGLPPDLKTLFQPAYDAGVRIHNNSWGAFLHSRYGATSLQLDAFVYSHPDFLPIVAAGNDGSCLPGKMVKTPGFVDFPSIAAPASAKNGLTVGASRNSRDSGGYSRLLWGQAWARSFPSAPIADETVSGEAEALAGFSARGPVDDGRIKPDLVAPGTDIASTRSADAPLRNFWGAYPGNGAYAFMGGTSMAAPLVAGCAALVRQYYRRDRKHPPSAALLKATLINGTTAMTHADAVADPPGLPNYHQGFGRIDLARTLPHAGLPDMRLAFVDSPRTSARIFTGFGQRFRWEIVLDKEGPLALCLVWTDPPARGLQNALMMVLDDGALDNKWVSNANAASLLKLDTPVAWEGLPIHVERDANNNVHIIRIANARAGAYTLTVICDLLTSETQNFAFVATGPIADLREING